MIFQTGPFQKSGAEASFHCAWGAKRMASSQKNPFSLQQAGSGSPGMAFRTRLSSSETRCCGSQNCRTRESGIRARVPVIGERQSVARIGSQTTRMSRFARGYRSRSFSAAEDPRRQVAQVGENSKSKRGTSGARSKAATNSPKFSGESVKRGVWFAGVLEGAPMYMAARTNSAARAARVTSRLLIFIARKTGRR